MATDKNELIVIDYNDEMKKSYIDYAMSVIVERTLPDIRDGFKPVHRRILYAMYELGLIPEKGYRKCARIVGDVLGKYHPHGDTAVYDALVRMAQDFRMGTTLVDGHGNFGSIDGDSPAAMRYTEAKLTNSALFMLQDLEKGVIKFGDNFDGTEKEPEVLPCKFPNLLINGSSGVAVGMATKIPPHNINESIDAVIAYIDNNNIDIEKLIDILPAPDFPSGGIIVNKEEVKNFYRTGKGKVIIRSKIEVEKAGNGRTSLIITEVPYTYSGNKSKMIDDIITLVNNKKIEEIVDVRDESSKEGIRIVLEVKRGVDIDNLLNKLYTKTKLQDKDSYIFLVIINGQPVIVNLKDYIKHYVDFQKEITIKKYNYLLKKEIGRKEILEGLVKAENVIDVIIEVLRGSKNIKKVRECLMSGQIENINFKTKKNEKIARTFNFTERQTNAILDMKLQKLIGLEVEKLNKEYEKVKKEIEKYTEILENEKKLLAKIKKYLKEFKKANGQKRKTEVKDIMIKEYVEEFKEEDMYILIDKFGYVKTVDTVSVDRSSEETLKEFKYKILTKNTDKLAVFTNKGNLYQVKLTDTPKGKIKDKGSPIEILCKIDKNEYPIFITTSNTLEQSKLLILTRTGLIKKTDGSEYKTNRTAILSTKLENGDEVVSIKIIGKAMSDIFVISKEGYILKFDIEEVPLQKKNSKGVKAIDISKNDVLLELCLTSINEQVSIKVNGKNINLNNIKKNGRAEKGIKV
ncbi:TPA: DNA topoisomerase 4 subunit A [Clostridium botulinum]|nr:DNA topoisomerase 4 subunit A [Clostridium botulinum]